MENFFAIGNDEIEKKDELGEKAVCPNCGKNHKIKYGTVKDENGNQVETKDLSFVKCPKNKAIYLVGVKGKKL